MCHGPLKRDSLLASVDRFGFFLPSERLFDEKQLQVLEEALSRAAETTHARKRGGETYALRNILKAVPAVQEIANSLLLKEAMNAVLGTGARAVKAILFDKTKSANWNLRWHQDNVISVRKRIDVDGFTGWSEKVGIPHARPPEGVLQNMLAARIHIDDCPEDNGALAVIPGSHAQGRMNLAEIDTRVSSEPSVLCACVRGQVLFMRPLLLHSSARSKNPRRRRVLHIEYAGLDLPGGLEWGV